MIDRKIKDFPEEKYFQNLEFRIKTYYEKVEEDC